jgi:hypothetical protein
MRSVQSLLMTIGSAAMLAGCMHNGQTAGDLDIDPAMASRTTVLRIDNRHATEMRIFAVANGKENYLGDVAAKRTRDFALDPAWVGVDVSFTTRLMDNSDALTRGPFRLEKGSVIEYLIPARSVDETNRTVVSPAT